MRELLDVNYRAHDALQDVRALQALFGALQPMADMICRHKFTLGAMETRAGAQQRRPVEAPRSSEDPHPEPPESL